MKRIIIKTMLFFLILPVYGNYRFRATTSEGVVMQFYSYGGSTAMVGNDTYSRAIDASTTGTITIPSEVEYGGITIQIVGILRNAFKDCASISKVIIPNSINEIQGKAFSGCSSLTEVVFQTGVTTIDDFVFENNTSLTEIYIPNTVSYMGSCVFSGCSRLLSVELPNSLNYISDGSFADCVSLSSITIPENFTSIGNNAFLGCTGLSSITLPENITSIGNNAFSGCTGLSSITIPKNVTSVGANSFERCTALSTVTIKSSNATTLGDYAFQNDTRLESINFGEGVTTIGQYCFQNCSVLESLNIPESVTSIGKYAFEGCISLKSVNMNNCAASIGQYAFSGCTLLSDVDWSERITSIDFWAFKNCTSLKSVIVSNSILSLNMNSFNNCSSVKDFVIKDGPTEIKISYNSLPLSLPIESVYVGRNIVLPRTNESLFRGINTLKKIEIGSHVEKSGQYWGCTNLSTVIINNGVKLIDASAFSNCSSLSSITIPESIDSIGESAFYDCRLLVDINLNNTHLKFIEAFCFHNCMSLKSISFPNSLESIKEYAFYGCTSLERIDLTNTKVLALNDFCFADCSILYSVAVPEELTILGSSAFEGCSLLQSFLWKRNLNDEHVNDVSIGASAFSSCFSLESVELPFGISIIEENAFYDCNALVEICIPSSVNTIGKQAFSKCSSLSTIILPNKLNTIGENAFEDCCTLMSINIPYAVSTIGNASFKNCSSLNKVYSDIVNPTDINSVFSGISPSATLYVPYDKKNIYQNCQGWNSIPNIIEKAASTNDTFTACIVFNGQSVNVPFVVKGVNPLIAYMGNGTSLPINDNIHIINIPTIVRGNDGTEFLLTGINSMAFNGTSISSLSIPYGVNYLGDAAFANCSQLDSVAIFWRHPSNVKISKDCFDGKPQNAILYIPAGTKERYEEVEPWNSFSQIIESSPVSISDVLAKKGSTTKVPIMLRSSEEISGIQFKLILPEGVSVAEDEGMSVVTPTNRTVGFTIMGRKDPDDDNSYLFVAFSLEGNPISGSEGEVMNIKLNVAPDLPNGKYDMTIEDVNMTTSAIETLYPSKSTSELSVTDMMIGDVNGDVKVDTQDAILVIQKYLGDNPDGFIDGAADINGDGVIDTQDAILMIENYLNNK